MDDIKTKENKTNFKEAPNLSDEKLNASLFDDTLKQIEETLKNLDKKIESKENILTNEDIYEEKTNSDNKEYTTEKTSSDTKEHTIDNSHVRMEKLHSFGSGGLIEEKNSFGFYTYLALSIGIIFAVYEILNFSKNLIIFKYPFTEPYIEYLYEVIEILTYLIMNAVSYVRNLF